MEYSSPEYYKKIKKIAFSERVDLEGTNEAASEGKGRDWFTDTTKTQKNGALLAED